MIYTMSGGSGSDAHRAATYSGVGLSIVFGSAGALHNAVAEGDFSHIHIGDYYPITMSGTFHDAATNEDKTINAMVRLEVAAINPYLGHGDTELAVPHLLLCSRDCLPPTLQYRSGSSTWYDTAATNPWLGSALFATLNNTNTGIIKILEGTEIGAFIFKGPNGKGMRAMLPNMAAGAESPASSSWADRGRLFLPTEREVYGAPAFASAGGFEAGNLYNQWTIFAGSSRHIMKGAGDGGSRCYWWLQSATSATHFSVATNRGDASRFVAENAAIRVPICFLFT